MLLQKEPVYEDAETLIVGNRKSAQEIEKRKNDQKRHSAHRSLVFWAYPELRRGDRRPLPACTYLFVRACSIVWMRICGRTITTLCMLNGLWVTMTFNLIHNHNFTKYHVGVSCYTSDCLWFCGVLLTVFIKQNVIAIPTLYYHI